MEKAEIYILWVFSFGIAFLLFSSWLSFSLKTENYIFQLGASENNDTIYINYFNIRYDFTSNRGLVTFLVDNDTHFKYLLIEFPSTIKNIEFDIQPEENVLKEIRPSLIILSNFSQQVKQYNITVSFISDLSPNAHFQIFSDPNQIVMYSSGPAIKFKLGSKYSCVGRCFIPLAGVEEYILSSPDEIMVNFKNDKIYDNHRFKIEARQEHVSSFISFLTKEFFFGLGVSFISASTISWISYRFYRKPF